MTQDDARAQQYREWGQRGKARPIERQRRSRNDRHRAIRFLMEVGVVTGVHQTVTLDERNEFLDDMAWALWALGVKTEELHFAMSARPRIIGGYIYTDRDWWP